MVETAPSSLLAVPQPPPPSPSPSPPFPPLHPLGAAGRCPPHTATPTTTAPRPRRARPLHPAATSPAYHRHVTAQPPTTTAPPDDRDRHTAATSHGETRPMPQPRRPRHTDKAPDGRTRTREVTPTAPAPPATSRSAARHPHVALRGDDTHPTATSPSVTRHDTTLDAPPAQVRRFTPHVPPRRAFVRGLIFLSK
ncbi:hypothetical protein FPV67DRAFT_1669497 [Lyophyllum atratum]|nr:hypothetical protein FPV67DRAFT_1669497 [Lyophyllum atratum]